MHVSRVSLDLNWFLQLILTVFVIIFVLLHLVKNTASKYFEVDANFEASGGGRAGRGGEGSDFNAMPGVPIDDDDCVVCANFGSKKCSRCKGVRYCSLKCQEIHWKAGHNTKCKDLQACRNINQTVTANTQSGSKASNVGSNFLSAIALVPSPKDSKLLKLFKEPKDILFPYDEFLYFFHWDKLQFPPCGLLNCGNSCFANVVLQCLSFTRPLVAFLLEKGHRSECVHHDWCFLCEFQTHVVRASRSVQSFSPNNIISRLPNIGGNLGYGRQEDAHEFMRFAIDRMQLACLDEFGGEKAVRSHSRETTIIQHIFGGHLQSQVICTNCNNVSNQHENMMDLTVEIHGDAASLEECLDQFTKIEWLHGDNMYKCDGCNDYVKASKRLTVKQAPNILTIALKRFQSGRFGKLNKKVTFPETLDLSPYMSEAGDCTDIYKLYAVVVHVDMLNASFFGHYICYIKDFSGNWYRIDDCKVVRVELEEVLSQGAYMIFYSRVRPRSSSLQTVGSLGNRQLQKMNVGLDACMEEQIEGATQHPMCSSESESANSCLRPDNYISGNVRSEIQPQSLRGHSEDMDGDMIPSTSKAVSICDRGSSFEITSEALRENAEDMNMLDVPMSTSLSKDDASLVHSEDMDGDMIDPSTSKAVSICDHGSSFEMTSEALRENVEDMNMPDVLTSSSLSKDDASFENNSPLLLTYEPLKNSVDTTTTGANCHCQPTNSMEVSHKDDLCTISFEAAREDSDVDTVSRETSSSVAQDIKVHANGHLGGREIATYSNGHNHGNEIIPLVDYNKLAANNQSDYLFDETSLETHKKMKQA